MTTPPSEFLDYINPETLDYQEWLNVGMALHHEGCDVSLWEEWSQRDSRRYHDGECRKKWAGFHGSASPVTGGTLVTLAQQGGWRPTGHGPGRAYDWDDVIGAQDDLKVLDTAWVEGVELQQVVDDPWRQLTAYIEALFDASEYVGYVREAWQQEERWIPKNRGSYTRTAGDILADLAKYKDIAMAMGDWTQQAGAWIRFNPLDGKGVRDLNVTSYRYALIESDTLSVEKQAAVYEELELPIVALVNSGGKSLHAIVRIGATSMEEYRERVNFLHKVCESNGLQIDKQNKNPSRLSRMPGVSRNGTIQALVGLNQGKSSWEEWKEWIEELNDSLPDIEAFSDFWDNMPELSPALIDGLLRRGHKMLLSGPSKAGKSYVLLELAIAIAEGRRWLGWQCVQGRVLYVNLELDRASCWHRLKSIYQELCWAPTNIANIDTWPLRGKSIPLDKLVPKLIRRAMKRRYDAIIFDPIYKIITGDENAADKMAFFCNQFDYLSTELGAAVIYCHHHSKGSQGQKSSRDRSSGSGVFARDPDAILDLIELNLEKQHRDVLDNRYACPIIEAFLNQHAPEWRVSIGQDTAIVAKHFAEAARELVTPEQYAALLRQVADTRTRVQNYSGWRLEGTLREFPPFPARTILFTYPIHVDDEDGVLESAKAAGEEAPWAAAQREKQSDAKGKATSQREALGSAFSCLSTFDDDPVMLGDLADHMGVSVPSLKRQLAKTRQYVLGDDNVVRTLQQAERATLDNALAIARDVSGVVRLPDLVTTLGLTARGVQKKLQRDGRYTVEGGLVVSINKEDK